MRTSFIPFRRTVATVAAGLALAAACVTGVAAQQPAAKAAPASAAKPATQPPAAKPATAPAAKAAPATKAAPQVDINHATVKELKTIPGIGDAYAAKIIKGRPYANKSQLVSRNILNAQLYETIQGMIIAKQ